MVLIGILLIILGVIFFLQNTGIIPFDTWNNIWPIILVVIGLGLMMGRRGWKLSSWTGRGESWRGRRDEDRSMGSAESRAYGHDVEEEDERMHDKRRDEM